MRFASLIAALLFAAGPARAEKGGESPSDLYDVKLEATPKVAKGGQGKVTARISPKAGAHVSKDAPSSLALAVTGGVAVSKAKAEKGELKFAGAAASFEVPFTAAASGEIDATLKFYICTDKACTQQERKAVLHVSVP